MTYYNADYLYNEFSQLAGMRKANSAYANDHTYWDGGECNWGGRHKLREDCQTIARGMADLQSLNNQTIANEVKSCTTKQEFDFKKNDLNRRINELNSKLHVKTGYSSSMFGVCCIWGQEGMSQHVESKLQECRETLNRLRNQLGDTKYEWVTELKRVQFEIDKIEAKMRENKQKAIKETDPIKKQALIAEIEADGKLLQAKYEERNKYTDKFKYVDVSKHVSSLVEAMKKAIENSFKKPRGGGSGGSGDRPNKPRNPNDPLGDDWFKTPSGSGGDNQNRTPRGKTPSQSEQKNNQQLILIAIVTVFILFFFMNQKEDRSYGRDYEEDYY